MFPDSLIVLCTFIVATDGQIRNPESPSFLDLADSGDNPSRWSFSQEGSDYILYLDLWVVKDKTAETAGKDETTITNEKKNPNILVCAISWHL